MKTIKQLPNSLKVIIVVGCIIGFGLFFYSFNTVLNGPHKHRQADSAFVGYFFCTEKTDLFHPHVAPRGLTEGTAINEFPIYGAIVGGICQIKGSWDEATPRIISLFFALAAAFLFWFTLKKRYNLEQVTWLEYLVLFLFIPVNWTFFTIPMPDSTGLFLYAFAGYVWSFINRKDSKYRQLIYQASGAVIFMMGFLVRPYYILFLFFYFPGIITSGLTLICCMGLFWLWYRYWNSMATSTHGYFGIQFQTSQEVLASLPNALAHLPTRIFEHTAIIGFWAFVKCWKKQIRLILFYIASILMMYILKSTHIADHGYYLLNAGVFATFALIVGYQELSAKQRSYFLAIFFIYTLSSTQHNFHKNNDYERTTIATMAAQLPQDALVVTYDLNPQWLYYLKRSGFIAAPGSFNGKCPEGATHYLIPNPQEITLKTCQ